MICDLGVLYSLNVDKTLSWKNSYCWIPVHISFISEHFGTENLKNIDFNTISKTSFFDWPLASLEPSPCMRHGCFALKGVASQPMCAIHLDQWAICLPPYNLNLNWLKSPHIRQTGFRLLFKNNHCREKTIGLSFLH